MSTPPEEDAFVLKFLLTVTAAAVAETGETIVQLYSGMAAEIAGITNIHCNACYCGTSLIMNTILW